jgi:integrase
MTKTRFNTDRQVRALKPASDSQRTDYCHATEKGFICRVSHGSKIWVVSHNVKTGGMSKRRKITFGTYPDLSLADALQKAREIKSDATSKGIDLVGISVERKTTPTVADLMDFYFENIEMATKTLEESKRINGKDILPLIGDMRAVDLTRTDVKALHKKIVDRGARVTANRTVELLRRAYNCAFEEEIIDRNPYPSLKKIKTAETSRDRILKDCEIKALWTAMEAERPNMRDIMRLLLLLGQRSMETMSMAVVDIDPDKREWTVPAFQTKNSKPNVLPLPPTAWKIIKPRLKNDTWIFPSKHNTTRIGAKRNGHAKSTKDARRRLRVATGLEGWTAHDLRRTCRTIMAREGVLPHIAEQVLGHSQGGIAEIYDQYSYLEEKRKALENVDMAIGRIVGVDVDNEVKC